MARDKINTGDTVKVNFNNAMFTLVEKGIVRHRPTATGDSWIVEDLKTEEVHAISEGCTITKIKMKEDLQF